MYVLFIAQKPLLLIQNSFSYIPTLAEGASQQERLPTHVCLQTGHCQIQVVGPAK